MKININSDSTITHYVDIKKEEYDFDPDIEGIEIHNDGQIWINIDVDDRPNFVTLTEDQLEGLLVAVREMKGRGR